MTTATATDHQQRLDHLETEKANYGSQLGNLSARLDVLRREAREAGPGATRAHKIRELEADETKLRGTLAQIERDLEAGFAAKRDAERLAQDEADLSRIYQAQIVEAKAAQVDAGRREALAAVEPHLLAHVEVEAEQRAARVTAKGALRSMAIRHGLLSPDSLPSNEENSTLSNFAHALGFPAELFASVVRPGLPVLAWPVLSLTWEEGE